MKTRPLAIRTTLACALTLLSLSGEASAQHPLDSWARRTVPSPNSILNSVAYGNGTFVAVGYDSLVVRSTNGTTWTTTPAGSYGVLKRVRFLNGQFVAVGSSDKILFSSDGATWTASTLPRTDFWDVALGNGAYVLAGTGTYVSSDGVNWTQTHPMSVTDFGIRETPLDTVVHGDDGFVALPTRGTGSIGSPRQSQFSTNGINWTARAFTQTSRFGGNGELLYQDGVWLSVMDDPGTSDVVGLFASTNNGVNWDRRVPNNCLSGPSALAYGQGYSVAFMCHNLDSIRLVTSTNGFLSWQDRFPVTNLSSGVRGCAFGNGTFVAVGYDQQHTSLILQSGNISGAPSIFQEPQDRSAVVGNPATFNVQAVGALPLVYQWYHNGAAINGETNTSYTIANVTTGDAGGYHAVITNSFGSVTSRVAQFTVAFLDIDLYAGIKVLGVPGRTYRIEATPASGAPNWQTLTNLVLPSNPYVWIDYESPAVSTRLYRAAELP